MKNILILILAGILVISGCSHNSNKMEGEKQPDQSEQAIGTKKNDSDVSGSLLDVSVDVPELENKGIDIQGNAEIDKFIRDDYGKFQFPSGTVEEVSYVLPGYKKVKVDMEIFKESIESIFTALAKAEERTTSTPYSPMDGAGLIVQYSHNNQMTNVELYSSYDMQTVFVRYSMDEGLYHDSGSVLSEELSNIIHQISGWKTFDTEKLKEMDSMTVQIVSGIAASDAVVTIAGEQARSIFDRMRSSAEVIDWGNGGYNILVKIYKGEELRYHAYLSGDSSPTIGIESQFFRIDSGVVREIYKELDYDTPVSNH